MAGNILPLYDREVALISADGSVSLQPESNAYSGDNPRAVITVDGTQFYMAGNSDSTIAKDDTGPGTTIGARYGTPGSNTSYQLGVYRAADRPDETTKQHVKDNNFRGIGIFNGNLYTCKGSGGNGDDGIFQVENGMDSGLPTGTGNTIVQLLGARPAIRSLERHRPWRRSASFSRTPPHSTSPTKAIPTPMPTGT